jgi:hypothetical protein
MSVTKHLLAVAVVTALSCAPAWAGHKHKPGRGAPLPITVLALPALIGLGAYGLVRGRRP